MKHTPGPWSIDSNNIIGPKSDGAQYQGAHEVIARLSDPIYCKENQRLILSAPELIDALFLAHDYLAGNGWDNDPRMIPIRAAILKATGDD